MILADDPTAAAVLEAVPCYPVPPSGRSPAIDALRAARSGHSLAIGRDGVMLILRRPWLELDVDVTGDLICHVPYGRVGKDHLKLRCGLIPRRFLGAILEHFNAALPNEAAAFVLWNESDREFSIEFPVLEQATPSRLVYRTPQPGPGWHIVCDVHSHGAGRAFFSRTDDTDDLHTTKIAIVIGRLSDAEGPEMVGRICANEHFAPLPRLPFEEATDAG